MNTKYVILLLLSLICFNISAQQTKVKDEAVNKLGTALYCINSMYFDKVDKDKMAEEAIIFMLSKLDPHSTYLSKEDVMQLSDPLKGNFDGVGLEFNMLNDTLYVVHVIMDGPSQKAGLESGDRIIFVNDTLIAGVKMRTTDIMTKFRGPSGTTVSIKVLRTGASELSEYKIVRDKIPMYSVSASYMVDKETGYIAISRFAETTHEEFLKALKDLQQSGMKNLIIDLQNNGGGQLTTAAKLVDELLDDGKLIVYTDGMHHKRQEFKTNIPGAFEEGRLVILINESSASASEVLSGAVQDWDRGVIVGRRSFGKGLVQQPVQLADGTMMSITVARYHTPTGRCIQKLYEKGKFQSYNHDISDRYKRGEMISTDSIHLPDSLKYTTFINKRIVYGGGGIMPDYFVPLDTTKHTKWHRDIIAKGLINKAAYSYIDQQKDILKKKYKSFDTYNQQYKIPESLLQELCSLAEKENIIFEPLMYGKSKTIITDQLRAIIARSIFEKKDYYFIIMNRYNDSFKEALEIIASPNTYNTLLEGN